MPRATQPEPRAGADAPPSAPRPGAPEAELELDGQYRALRERAGWVGREGRGMLALRGAQAAEYLQGQVTNDVAALAPGEGCYAALLDRKGHMRGDLRVLRVDDELWLDTEPQALPALRGHLATYLVGFDARIEDRTGELEVISVIGPAAAELLEAGDLEAEHAHRHLLLAAARARAVRTDVGVDLIAERGEGAALVAALAEREIEPVSERAAEIVRVETGRPRFGREMTERTIPAEAGINERAVSFTKGCYIGQETVARLHYKGRPNRQLRGLRIEGEPGDHAPLRTPEREVGELGSWCVSPALGTIGLAIVRREVELGDELAVGDHARATVTELPFAGPSAAGT